MLPEDYRARLRDRKERNELRTIPQPVSSAARPSIDFASNDYLGFARAGELLVRARDLRPRHISSGSTGSRLLTGSSPYLCEVERVIALFHNQQSALLCGSGYLANLSLFSTLPTRHDVVLYDSLIHASMRDGISLSPAKAFSFRHNDLEDLETKLSRFSSARKGGRCIVAVESLYSMDGDEAPLCELVQLSRRYNALVCVDEAHAVGTRGERGEGLVSAYGLTKDVAATVVTYGKALGSHGAAILGTDDLKEYLINFARPVIYTTAIDDHTASLIHAGYQLLSEDPNHLAALRAQCCYLLDLFSRYQKAVIPAGVKGPIFPIIVPGAKLARGLAYELRAQGMIAFPVVAPTVARGRERIRVCLHAFNTAAEIDSLVSAIDELLSRNHFVGARCE